MTIKKKTLKALQKHLIKQKKEIIEPKLYWIMRTSCINHITPRIHIFPLDWIKKKKKNLCIELVMCVINHDGKYIEI